jgi:hypothetical protein
MFRTLSIEAELEKASRGRKTAIGIADLAALVLQTGIGAREPKRNRMRGDIAFLEALYRLEDARD